MQAIAAGIGVDRKTIYSWIQAAKSGKGSDLQIQFHHIIQSGAVGVEKRCLAALDRAITSTDCRDSTPAATWILTHHPLIRDNWSDAAATRREIDRVLGQVAKGIAESGLPLEQQQALILSIRANGVGVGNGTADD